MNGQIKPRQHVKRNYMRYSPDNTLAYFDFDSSIETFNPKIVSLVYSESFKGCAVVMVKNEVVENRTTCIIQCGELEPVVGKIAWTRELDEGLIKVGVEFMI